MSYKTLIVEDSPTLSQMYQGFLVHSGYQADIVHTGEAASRYLSQCVPDLILLDLGLPDVDGLELLERLRASVPHIPVVIITGNASLQVAVRAMRTGALDYLVKPFDQTRLTATVESSLERSSLRKIVSKHSETLSSTRPGGMIGESRVMQTIYRTIDAVALSDASVFITGETGTGKEMAAKALHERSKRSRMAFHTVNCSAIPVEFMEGALFGQVKDASSGAAGSRDGLATLADGGTLFFDEIVALPVALQAKLLRFIQQGTFQKLGETTPRTADIRFICATNQFSLDAIKNGALREDLYYRLNVIPIEMPPLKERGNDVLRIGEAFLKHFAQKKGKGFKTFAKDVRIALLAYEWPGNVRQLQNVIRNAVVLNDGEELTLEMLPQSLLEANAANLKARSIYRSPQEEILPLSFVERQAIEAAIKAAGGNIQKAAQLLEIDPSTIHRRRRNWKAVA